MPISMEPFASEGAFPTYDPWHTEAARVGVFTVQCCECGHEMPQLPLPRVCPKCNGGRFEQLVVPGSILANALRH